jgi:hypothetical protein
MGKGAFLSSLFPLSLPARASPRESFRDVFQLACSVHRTRTTDKQTSAGLVAQLAMDSAAHVRTFSSCIFFCSLSSALHGHYSDLLSSDQAVRTMILLCT